MSEERLAKFCKCEGIWNGCSMYVTHGYVQNYLFGGNMILTVYYDEIWFQLLMYCRAPVTIWA